MIPTLTLSDVIPLKSWAFVSAVENRKKPMTRHKLIDFTFFISFPPSKGFIFLIYSSILFLTHLPSDVLPDRLMNH